MKTYQIVFINLRGNPGRIFISNCADVKSAIRTFRVAFQNANILQVKAINE